MTGPCLLIGLNDTASVFNFDFPMHLSSWRMNSEEPNRISQGPEIHICIIGCVKKNLTQKYAMGNRVDMCTWAIGTNWL